MLDPAVLWGNVLRTWESGERVEIRHGPPIMGRTHGPVGPGDGNLLKKTVRLLQPLGADPRPPRRGLVPRLEARGAAAHAHARSGGLSARDPGARRSGAGREGDD